MSKPGPRLVADWVHAQKHYRIICVPAAYGHKEDEYVVEVERADTLGGKGWHRLFEVNSDDEYWQILAGGIVSLARRATAALLHRSDI